MELSNTNALAFSIVVPTYNRAHLIDKTIESILQQDTHDFELLIIDDGSKDNTEEVVKKFVSERIHYYKKDNAERGAARNYGAARAKGRYINFFDSDDLMLPNHLREARKLLAEVNEPEIFHLGYDCKLADGTVLKQVNSFNDSTKEMILFDNVLSCNGVFLRKDIVMKFSFEENRALASSEDWELWIRLLSRFKLHYSNEITSTIVGHDHRSIYTISSEKIIARDLLLIEKLKSDSSVLKMYGKRINKFIANRYTYFMLSLAQEKKYREVISWAFRASRIYPLILLDKRFLASMKKVIVS